MEQCRIILHTVKDAEAFVYRVSAWPQRIELVMGEDRMDAKSFLGIIGIGLGRTAVVEIPQGSEALTEELKEFAV